MKLENLDLNDLEIILESFKYSLQRIADYQDHPSYEFKQQQLKRITDVANKVRELKKAMQLGKSS